MEWPAISWDSYDSSIESDKLLEWFTEPKKTVYFINYISGLLLRIRTGRAGGKIHKVIIEMTSELQILSSLV